MFNQEALLEFLISPEGLNKVILGIILVAAINAIFITYTIRSTFGLARKEREKQQIQQSKIEKLSPKCSSHYAIYKTLGRTIKRYMTQYFLVPAI